VAQVAPELRELRPGGRGIQAILRLTCFTVPLFL